MTTNLRPQDKALYEQMLDDLTFEHAQKNSVDRPTARVAVLKTARGKELYAKSVGRYAAPQVVANEASVAKSASEYEADLVALAKSKGLRLADAMKTAEGRELYNLSVAAARGGVR